MTHRTKAVRAGEKKLIRVLRRKLKQLATLAAQTALAHIPEWLLNKSDDDAEAARIGAAAAQAAVEALDWNILINATEEELDEVSRDGVRQALLRLGITDEGIVDQAFEEASSWAKDRAAEMVGMRYNAADQLEPNPNAEFQIGDAARDEIQAKVEEAIREGWSADDLADEIMSIGSFSEARAEMIARTEIIRANNEGHMIAFRESGVVEQKAWSTAEDGDVCIICTENEDQGAIPLDDSFISGDDAAPAHPNCRCVIVAVIQDEAPEIDSQGSS